MYLGAGAGVGRVIADPGLSGVIEDRDRGAAGDGDEAAHAADRQRHHGLGARRGHGHVVLGVDVGAVVDVRQGLGLEDRDIGAGRNGDEPAGDPHHDAEVLVVVGRAHDDRLVGCRAEGA